MVDSASASETGQADPCSAAYALSACCGHVVPIMTATIRREAEADVPSRHAVGLEMLGEHMNTSSPFPARNRLLALDSQPMHGIWFARIKYGQRSVDWNLQQVPATELHDPS